MKEFLFVYQILLESSTTNTTEGRIILGMMVRVIKIGKSVLHLSGAHIHYGQNGLGRLIYESCVTIAWLLGSSDKLRFENYIKNGLLNEKRLLKRIEEDIDNNNGVKLPIQERMISSVEYTAKEANLTLKDVREIPSAKKIGIPNVYERTKFLDPSCGLYLLYRNMSGETHGSFHELVRYNTERKENFIEAEFHCSAEESIASDSRVTLPLIILINKSFSEVLKDNVFDFNNSSDKELLVARIRNIMKNVSKLDAAHERLLQDQKL
ncbi:hypothetical protein IV36_GL001769 [Liquorilactobacillus mali]|uniref:Uncharacterized protein n=2 Tax=Liquorilactobacillus mali TaxID=1618 RepID=A0A0R2G421_9LACO|nr:hypothetical protein IV36_GL001769 [Liquorilactobacillus mali]